MEKLIKSFESLRIPDSNFFGGYMSIHYEQFLHIQSLVDFCNENSIMKNNIIGIFHRKILEDDILYTLIYEK